MDMNWKNIINHIFTNAGTMFSFCIFVLSNLNPVATNLIMFQDAQIRIYKRRFGKFKPTKDEKMELAQLAKFLPAKVLKEFTGAFVPRTYYRWFKDLISKKFDSSHNQSKRGRPPKDKYIENYVRRVCKEHPDWGDKTIANSVTRIFQRTCPNTIKNIRKKFGIPPADKRSRWDYFKKQNRGFIWSCDFFTREVFTQYGLMTYYVLIFVHMQTKQLKIAGATINPSGDWTVQMARNAVNIEERFVGDKYLIRDNDPRFTDTFDKIFDDADLEVIRTATKAPKMNAHAERCIRSIRELVGKNDIFYGETQFLGALREYEKHFNTERPHQGIDGKIPFPEEGHDKKTGGVRHKTRCSGKLGYYYRAA